MAVSGDGGTLSKVSAWFLDTGASSHATPGAAMMTHSEDYSGNDVLRVGNGTCLGISRIGFTSIPQFQKCLKCPIYCMCRNCLHRYYL